MFKNYFKIAIRNFRHNSVFTIINIAGLSIGISASIVIFLLVNYHFSFDKFEADKQRIYRIVSDFNSSGDLHYNAGVISPLGAAIKSELTGINSVVAFRTWNDDIKITLPSINNQTPVTLKHQKNIVFADKEYFNLIGYKWIAGSAENALQKPCQMVLSQSVLNTYFPNQSATEIIGKQLYINDTIGLTITGVVKDITANTNFSFKTFISHATLTSTNLGPGDFGSWENTNGASQLYVKLNDNKHPTEIEKAINQLYNRHYPNAQSSDTKTIYRLQSLDDIHFNPNYGAYEIPVVSKKVLFGLLAIAAFLLLLGCINFINLNTVQSSQRAKEIGIRKTLGSLRQQLIFKFLSEAFLLTTTSTLISIALIPFALKAFTEFIPQGLNFSYVLQPGILLFVVVLVISVTGLSGFYPALILSGYKPISVLRNNANKNASETRSTWLRKSLTVSQFVIAQFFILASLLVSKQIGYMLNKNMGFKKDAIIYFSTSSLDALRNRKYVLIDKLRSISEINMVSLSTNPPSINDSWSGTMKYVDGKKEIETNVQEKFGDTNYIRLYNIKLLAGNNLTQSDTVNKFLINESYAHILGFQNPQQALGKNINWNGKQISIVGVIKDFYQASLHEPIKPMVIGSLSNPARVINISLSGNSATWKTAIAKIEKVFQEVYPEDDFDYRFFDQEISKFYVQEQNILTLLKWATGLAIFISCLGLLGLVLYTTVQRAKEIGIRKILGASVSQIIALVSKDFLLLVLFAFVITTPLAFLSMNKWLQNFADRTSINWWLFAATGIFMTLIVLITISTQIIKAALANPVKSLRTE